MVRLELLDFLLARNPLRIRKCSDDAWLRLDTVLYNETRLIAVGSHKCTNIYFTYEYY